MDKNKLKKTLAGVSIAALMAGGAVATGCSKSDSSCSKDKKESAEKSSEAKSSCSGEKK